MQHLSSLLLKVPLILLTSWSAHVSLTAPNPPPRPQEMEKYASNNANDIIPLVQLRAPAVEKAIMHILNAIELFSIVTATFPSIMSLNIHSSTFSSIDAIRITPTYAAAVSVMIFAAFIRLACYRELGRVFTYELSIKEEHRLITSGPYSIVRHPSYTGLLLYFAACMPAQTGPGSWWYESGCWSTAAGQLVGALWVVLNICFVIFLVDRAAKEDIIMRKEFRDAWETWARRTPYKYWPYVW